MSTQSLAHTFDLSTVDLTISEETGLMIFNPELSPIECEEIHDRWSGNTLFDVPEYRVAVIGRQGGKAVIRRTLMI